MSIVRFEMSGRSGEVVRSTPEGTGEVLVRVDIDTSIAQAIGTADRLHLRDVVHQALKQVLVSLDSHAPFRIGGDQ